MRRLRAPRQAGDPQARLDRREARWEADLVLPGVHSARERLELRPPPGARTFRIDGVGTRIPRGAGRRRTRS